MLKLNVMINLKGITSLVARFCKITRLTQAAELIEYKNCADNNKGQLLQPILLIVSSTNSI